MSAARLSAGTAARKASTSFAELVFVAGFAVVLIELPPWRRPLERGLRRGIVIRDLLLRFAGLRGFDDVVR